MKKQSVLNWRECYCAIDIDANAAHGALAKAADAVASVVSARMNLLDSAIFSVSHADTPTLYGSGFGALEEKLRKRPISKICIFPEDSLGDEQSDWLALLENKPFPTHSVNDEIRSYVVGKPWITLMERLSNNDWYYHNQLGVMRYAGGDTDGAVRSFRSSIAATDNAWAHRNLAQIQKNIFGEWDAAADNMLRARALLPDYIPLAVECFAALLKAGRYDELYALYPTLPEEVRAYGRTQMLLGDCCARMGKIDEARAIITKDLVVPDVMEGEYSLSNIWTSIYTEVLASQRGVNPTSLTVDEVLREYPLPEELDFRMH